MTRTSLIRRVTAAAAAGTAALLSSLAAAPVTAMTHHVVIPVHSASLHMTQSGNWSGYNMGSLSHNDTLFTSISGEWRVPAVSLHTAGTTESSSNWIGIGGGCVDSACDATDSTLIQTGTEQDATPSGSQYSAWWEIIPAPSLTISNFTVAAGDLMDASITQVVPGIWTVSLKDVTRGESFSQTVPYTSTELSAEWITETPVVINGTGTGIATMPDLSADSFDLATVNDAPASFSSADAMQLSANGTIESTPSAPDSDGDGFAVCSYATTCAAPSS